MKPITQKVSFLDLKKQYNSIKEEINKSIQEVIDSCSFSGGPFVEKFEEQFARYCNCKYAAGVGSGTEALWLTLLALDIGPGDEVITVPNTFIATVEAIRFCGAKPVFVDVDERTYTMKPQLLENVITSNTKAIIPVHLFGQMADMNPIQEISNKYGIYLIEDACQSHGAEYKGKRAGSVGDAGCFSFYPSKNLGAYGEAGIVVTNNKELYNRIKILRDHGQSKKYYHTIFGFNARMDGIQGAILSVKLRYLDKWNDARRKKAQIYNERLQHLPYLVIPYEADNNKHVYHLYVVRVKKREEILNKLQSRQIQYGIHYPVPVHLQQSCKSYNENECNYKVTETLSSEILSLPIYPELEQNQMLYVINALCESAK